MGIFTHFPTVSMRWFFMTSVQQFSLAGQPPVLSCYLLASLIILCCNLVWIFKVALMSCSQAAVTQRILMKLTERDSYSFTEAAGQRTLHGQGSLSALEVKIPRYFLHLKPESLQLAGWVVLVAVPALTWGDEIWLDHHVLSKWLSRLIPVLTYIFLF